MVFWAAQVDIVALVRNQFGICCPATPSDEMLAQLKESERGLNDTVAAFPSSPSSVELVPPL